MAFASISSSMASPFQQMQREATEALYGMGLTGEMEVGDIRRKAREMNVAAGQMGRFFNGPMFQPQTESLTYNDGRYSSFPSMPYTNVGLGRSIPFGMANQTTPFSASSWSTMGPAPQFPSATIISDRDLALRRF